MSRSVPEAQRIVVVGGTGGLGSAVVEALLARGDRVLATGPRPRPPGGARGGAGRRRGRSTSASPACGAALAAAAREELGDALDGLVLVAGRLEPIGPTRTVDLDALARTLDEHVLGALRVVQACAPLLDAAGAPSVVLFSGGGATGPFPRYSAYALAKVATVRLAENLAAEEPGWRVNAVAPGFVATGMHETTLASDRDDVGPYWEETERRLRDATPPEVAAELVAFLMSEEAAGISGRLVSAVWDPWRERGRPGRPARADGLRAPAAHRRPALPRRRLMPPRAPELRRVPPARASSPSRRCARRRSCRCCCPSSCGRTPGSSGGTRFWLFERQADSIRELGPPELLPPDRTTPGPSTRSSSSTAARSSPSPGVLAHRARLGVGRLHR